MAENTVVISVTGEKSIKILKWKVKEGFTVSIGKIILLYDFEANGKPEQRKLKAGKAGKVKRLVAEEGDIIAPGGPILELSECTHPTVMRDMCGECGADLRQDSPTVSNAGSSALVSMIHSVPDLKVSHELAQKLGREDAERLLKDRKLVLLVDLDQTLIHTTNDQIPENIKDVHHFQLYGRHSPWYHTRLRPGTLPFLSAMAPLYELHICTFGARNYAHTIARVLDANQQFFSQRILSRDECFNATSKTANLKSLFPCGDNMVCIIDDREDVWSHAPNLIHVKPYHFFQHTGDINAPPGLAKTDLDDLEGVDLTAAITKDSNAKSNEIKDASAGDDKLDVILEDNSDDVKKIIESTIDELMLEVDIGLSSDIDSIKEKSEPILKESAQTVINAMETDFDNLTTLLESADDIVSKPEEDPVVNTNKSSEPAPVTEVKDTTNSVSSHISTNGIGTSDVDEVINITSVTDNGLVDVEDPDDYLLYLEVILKNIHKTFYEMYDKLESGTVPDLKSVIPGVKRNVLPNVSLVFSGLVPTHVKLEQSKAYQVARSLGAEVTQDFTSKTTHLVAVRPGTAKVNSGRRRKGLHIVTPEWLWTCAERWEHVAEPLFPLSARASKHRHPPPHCSSPERMPVSDDLETHGEPMGRKRTASGRFMDTINPLLTFSTADIADMDREVEDIFNESESDGDTDKDISNGPNKITSDPMPLLDLDNEPDEETEAKTQLMKELSRLSNDSEDGSSSSTEGETLSGGEQPHGWKEGVAWPRKRRRSSDGDGDKPPSRLQAEKRHTQCATENTDSDTLDDEGTLVKRFKRGQRLPSTDMFERDSDNDSVGSDEPPDEIDDGEWNMMGAALEREFLGLD